MRRLAITCLLLSAAVPVSAQDSPPAHWAELELGRTAMCTDVLSRLETLDAQLAPLAARAQRLLAIGGAIELEESSVVDSLDTADPLEAAVHDWFVADQELAQQYLTDQSQATLDQRAAGRQAIQDRVAQALDEIQARADSVMQPTGTLQEDAVACGGVILVRGAAVEACGSLQSRVCGAARDSTVESPFRFVDSPDDLWYREELRPWTAPGPMQLSPQGQLSGARTIGNTRIGNVVIGVALNPVLRTREELSAEEAAVLDSIDAPLGIRNVHPDITFAPGLAIQAALPHALGDETGYVLHFDAPEDADVVWAAPADTGAPLAGSVALAPAHVTRLARGEALTLTAVRAGEDGENAAVFSLQLTTVNQAARVQSLLAYLAQQLSTDLERLIPPGTSDAPVDSAVAPADPGPS